MRRSLIYFLDVINKDILVLLKIVSFQSIFQSRVVCRGIISDGLYRMSVNEPVSFHTDFGNNLLPYALSDRRLGHISQDNENIDEGRDSSYYLRKFKNCIECVKIS